MTPAAIANTSERLAASASASGPNACAAAVEGAVATLDHDPGLVLIFPAGHDDPDAAAGEARVAACGARVAGMTGTAAISAGDVIASGCSAIAISSALATGVGVAETDDPRRAGLHATETALAEIDDAAHAVVLLFVDSECGDQADIVAGAYAVAGGAVPLAGGAAGGPARARFVDGRALSRGVVAVAIGSAAPIGVGVAHGCVPRGVPSIVTRSAGHTILQLDGRPAQDVYFEKLGLADAELGDVEFEALATAHPLAQPELSGAVRPRYVRARCANGGLVCATPIERNAAVVICDQTAATIFESARAAVDDALAQLRGPAQAAVVFDCAARSAWLSRSVARRELKSLVAAFGDPEPCVAGVYTRGEIGRARGAKGDRNHSIVVTAFGAPD